MTCSGLAICGNTLFMKFPLTSVNKLQVRFGITSKMRSRNTRRVANKNENSSIKINALMMPFIFDWCFFLDRMFCYVGDIYITFMI